MMISLRALKFAAAIFSIALGLSCSSAPEPPKPKVEVKTFPAAEVCGYPATSKIIKLHPLGGGTWQPVSPEVAESAYGCSEGTGSVQLLGDSSGSVGIDYSVTGEKSGATMIEIGYNAAVSGVGANEPTLRNVYANFAGEILQNALKQPMPDLAKKKLSNLNSYLAMGKDGSETIMLGEGFFILSRNKSEDNSAVNIKMQIFSDKALKLK